MLGCTGEQIHRKHILPCKQLPRWQEPWSAGKCGTLWEDHLQGKGKDEASYHLVRLSFPAEFPHGFELQFRYLQCLNTGQHHLK